MSIVKRLLWPDALAIRLLNPLQPVFALGARWYVGVQFLRSGYLKVTSWDSTLYLFENEYHTPVLPPHVAAYAGAFGELFFPSLLVVGFMSRLSADGDKDLGADHFTGRDREKIILRLVRRINDLGCKVACWPSISWQ